MSVAFTNPGGATWQTLLNEITLAYSERRQVLGQSAYTPAASRNVQSAAYWQGLQSWLETNCMSFVDYVNGPVNAAGDGLLYFTLAKWRAAAGINPAGFKRANNGAISYGLMQQNDEIRSWVFSEIQNGFSVLRKTGTPGYARMAVGSVNGGDVEYEIRSDVNAMKAIALSLFNAARTTELEDYGEVYFGDAMRFVFGTHSRIFAFTGDWYDVGLVRTTHLCADGIKVVPNLSHNSEVYAIIYDNKEWRPWESDGSTVLFKTFGDSIPLPKDGVFQKIAESNTPSSASSVRIALKDDPPEWCTVPAAGYANLDGWSASNCFFVTNWEFTNI